MDEYDIGEHSKTVYAHFALAIYLAQCLEHGIVNALVYLDLIPRRAPAVRNAAEWAAAVDAFMDRHFEDSLGRMVGNLKQVTDVGPDLEHLLSEALRKRNWLAHHYFRERASDFMNRAGHDRMIAELEEAQGLFRRADRSLEAVLKPVREKWGFTDERLHEQFERLRKESMDDV